MNSKELKPCPYCGGECKLRSKFGKPYKFYIGCENFKCLGWYVKNEFTRNHQSPKDFVKFVISFWNRRATRGMDREKLAALIAEYCNTNSLLYDGCKGLADAIISAEKELRNGH